MRIRTRFALLICFLASHSLATAQGITASLQGVVQDSTGAVITGAKVAVINTATNAATPAVTASDGSFVVTSLPPGPYRVEIEANGFKKLERSDIDLRVDQSARLLLTLEIGALSESVKVTGESPLLEPTTSSLGQVIESSAIVNLPLNQRNPFALIFLATGVQGNVDRSFNQVNWSANGGRPGTNEILIDGVPSSPPVATPIQGFSIIPSVDAVQEFKLQTNNYSAEYGRSGGSIVNLIYKSGSNEFHGSAFEFLRNSRMDANDFFANRNGVPLISFKRNQFGISGGGPVVIPHLYNGHNRTFFYATFEGLRERQADGLLNATMPTEKQRSGDFSETLNNQGKLVTIYDPITTATTGSPIRQPFPGNIIPANRQDPVGKKAMSYFPLPNGPGDAISHLRNYNVAAPDPIGINQGEMKVDQILNTNQRFFVRVSRRKFQTDAANFFPEAQRIAQGGSTQNQDSIGAAADYTWTVTPTYLLNFRAGFSRMHLSYVPLSDGFDPTQLGFPAYVAANSDRLVFPGFAPAGYRAIGNGGYDFRRNSFQTMIASLSNTKIHGVHVFKFGMEARLLRVDNTETYRPAGLFNFPKEMTQGPVATTASNIAGDGLASMLLGLGNGNLTRGNKSQTTKNPYYGFYFADDWKLTSRLTLNLGLRYDLELPRVELYDRMTKFDPNMTSPLAGPAGLPNLKGGIVFVGANGLPRTQSDTDTNNFAPRVGLAYQATRHMAVRAAYGIFYAPSLMAATGDIANLGSRSDTPYIGGRDGDPIYPLNYLRDPFPNGFAKAAGPSLGALTGVGDSITSYIGNSLTPYTQNWNFSLQYELPHGVLIESSYVGARGLKLNESAGGDYNLDQLNSQQLALGNAYLTTRVPNPFLGLISPIFSLGAATVRNMDLIRAFPQYGALGQSYRIGASSWYHSYQLRVEKRFRGGLGALLSYTNGKQIDDHSAITIVGNDLNHQNIYDRKADRSISPNDVSQRLVLSWVAELPLGRGRWFGKSMNRWLDGAIGGWQFNGIMSMQRGQPFSILGSQNPNFGSAQIRANNNGTSATLSGPVKERLTRYFNTSVFSQPASFSFGNVGRTLPDVRAPGMENFDLSLFKNFKLFESHSLQFRFEAFNALNRTQFASPIPGVNNTSFGWILGTANTPRQLQIGLKYLF